MLLHAHPVNRSARSARPWRSTRLALRAAESAHAEAARRAASDEPLARLARAGSARTAPAGQPALRPRPATAAAAADARDTPRSDRGRRAPRARCRRFAPARHALGSRSTHRPDRPAGRRMRTVCRRRPLAHQAKLASPSPRPHELEVDTHRRRSVPPRAPGRWSRPACTRCWRGCSPRAACDRATSSTTAWRAAAAGAA